MQNVYLAILLAPLLAAVVAGLFGKWVGRAGAHTVTILGVAVSFLLSCWVFDHHVLDGAPAFDGPVYTWLATDGLTLEIGLLVDRLTVLMMLVVTFVSLMVHVYTIGYMHDDPGYQRFFSYISLFTFSMLLLVMSNNFLQLFIGWELVGLVSYLLIGFWWKRPTAVFANMKAFLVNRVGDFGFILGIAGVYYFTDSLHYADAFEAAQRSLQACVDSAPDFWCYAGLIEHDLLQAVAGGALAGQADGLKTRFAELHGRLSAPYTWASVADQGRFLLGPYAEHAGKTVQQAEQAAAQGLLGLLEGFAGR